MLHDLAELLFKSFRQHSFAPTPRARRPRSTILTPDPSLRITDAGAIKISRSDSHMTRHDPTTGPHNLVMPGHVCRHDQT